MTALRDQGGLTPAAKEALRENGQCRYWQGYYQAMQDAIQAFRRPDDNKEEKAQ